MRGVGARVEGGRLGSAGLGTALMVPHARVPDLRNVGLVPQLPDSKMPLEHGIIQPDINFRAQPSRK